MTREVQAILLLLVGGAVLRISIGDTYLNYVKEAMRPWLLLSGGLLVVLGALAFVDVLRSTRRSAAVDTDPDELDPAHPMAPPDLDDDLVTDGPVDDADHGHHQHHGPRAAWLLLLPVLAIFLVAPPALGAYAAARDDTNALPPSSTQEVPGLPPGDPVELAVSDYVVRAVWGDGRTLDGRTVQLTGFATPDPAGGWWLTRMMLACCAADALPSKVKVLDTPDLPADTWVTVTGRWVPGGGTQDADAIPLLRVETVRTIPQPKNPYE